MKFFSDCEGECAESDYIPKFCMECGADMRGGRE